MKKIICLILAALMLFAALTGCSKKVEDAAPATDAEAPAQTSQDSTETAEGETKKYNVTLHVVGVDNVVSTTFMQYADELEELYGITIDFQQFSNEQSSNKIAVSMAAGGSDIDVMMIRPLDGTLLYSQNGWLENLQPYIDADPSVEYDDFMTACADVCTDADGDTVCLPVMTESGVIFYNKTLFEKAGITKTPETWEELYETAVKLNDPANDICGFACRGSGNPAVTQFSAVIRSFGGDFFDENKNATINTPEAIEAFQFYGKLLRDAGPAGVLNMGWIETWNLFTQGKCAMRLDANTNLGSWNDDDSVISLDEVGFFDVPTGPNGGYGNYYITSWALAISSGSPNKEAAWQFVKWASSKEMQIRAQQNGNSGARLSCWAEDYLPWPQEAQEIAAIAGNKSYGTDRPYCINVSEARDLIGEVIVAAIEGTDDASLQKLADEKNAQFQALLDSEKQ